MLSRVADCLYWMSRNIERAESNARILNVQFIQMLEASEEEILAKHDWEMIFEICARTDLFHEAMQEPTGADQALIHQLVFARANPNSLMNCVQYARENARMTRTQLPDDLWEIWNDVYLDMNRMNRGEDIDSREVRRCLERTKIASLTARGIIESSMSRGPAYHMINVGKWLEQAEKTARILDVVSSYIYADPACRGQGESYYWRLALQFANGYEAFLKRHPPAMEPGPILSFLVADEAYPKSIRYCISQVRESVQILEYGRVSHYSWEMYASLDDLLGMLDEVHITELRGPELDFFLSQFQEKCKEIGHVFSRTYYLMDTGERQFQFHYAGE
ncbi:alpha-E domain-containing protein [Paenibacillus urinalis]|uniref:Alpha-E domain-containing protein n=2 Tax=Paenibacillus urinalis TaxID=521520 RepID=A0ABY7XBQ8_9BACL|nr:alpha-E domain-containing protein [Paenibacillus urinalis]WDH98586.1 alpha-E domain-containing protein [Paenibacillus urinalis]WDI02279.1 alpha-E domain-containing protein [Paenibacillus urinalis]